MMNLLLAAVYSDYDKFMKAKREKVEQNQKANLEEAFRLLDVEGDGKITKVGSSDSNTLLIPLTNKLSFVASLLAEGCYILVPLPQ